MSTTVKRTLDMSVIQGLLKSQKPKVDISERTLAKVNELKEEALVVEMKPVVEEVVTPPPPAAEPEPTPSSTVNLQVEDILALVAKPETKAPVKRTRKTKKTAAPSSPAPDPAPALLLIPENSVTITSEDVLACSMRHQNGPSSRLINSFVSLLAGKQPVIAPAQEVLKEEVTVVEVAPVVVEKTPEVTTPVVPEPEVQNDLDTIEEEISSNILKLQSYLTTQTDDDDYEDDDYKY